MVLLKTYDTDEDEAFSRAEMKDFVTSTLILGVVNLNQSGM